MPKVQIELDDWIYARLLSNAMQLNWTLKEYIVQVVSRHKDTLVEVAPKDWPKNISNKPPEPKDTGVGFLDSKKVWNSNPRADSQKHVPPHEKDGKSIDLKVMDGGANGRIFSKKPTRGDAYSKAYDLRIKARKIGITKITANDFLISEKATVACEQLKMSKEGIAEDLGIPIELVDVYIGFHREVKKQYDVTWGRPKKPKESQDLMLFAPVPRVATKMGVNKAIVYYWKRNGLIPWKLKNGDIWVCEALAPTNKGKGTPYKRNVKWGSSGLSMSDKGEVIDEN
tara:strand:- start:1701 stop:2552 length:852 start_codon:yes stop_codon:yes gene_type:complete